METDNKRLYDGTGEEQTSKKPHIEIIYGEGYPPCPSGVTFSYANITPAPVDPLTFLYNQFQALEKVVQELHEKVRVLEAQLQQQPITTGPSNGPLNGTSLGNPPGSIYIDRGNYVMEDPCASRCIGSSLNQQTIPIITEPQSIQGPIGPMGPIGYCGAIGLTGACGTPGLRY